MTTHHTAHGTIWYDPVRSATGGTRLRFWIDRRLQVALAEVAEARGISLQQAARLVLDAWLAQQEQAA